MTSQVVRGTSIIIVYIEFDDDLNDNYNYLAK